MDPQLTTSNLNLPRAIRVEIAQGESGVYIAELPEYGVFTEADSISELPDLVNDLIYTVFDIPKELQSLVRYEPPRPINIANHLLFQKFISSEASRIFV